VTSAARRLIGLDALRGASALVVVLHHVRTLFPASSARLAHGSELAGELSGFVSSRSTEAVLLFFVLSGLSIRLSVERRGLGDRASIGDYLRRRAQRILPPYVLALAVSALVAHTIAPVPAVAVSLSTLAGNLLFLQTAIGVPGQWFMPYAGNAPLWSLSFEVFYYLSYPLLVAGIPDARRRSLVVLALSALGFAAGALAANPFAMFCAAFPIWYFGVELAELYLHGRATWPLRAFAVLSFLLAAARVSPRGLEFHGVWVGSCMFLIGALLLSRRERLRALHERARAPLLEPLAVVGVVSYPLYLLHVPILRACHALLGDSASSLAAALCVSLAIAWCVEHGLRGSRRADTHAQVSTVAGP
jgi:peptidoglycan/LPS O-acetylase OafA/YrhL